ncbi:MAG: hypothetical protein Q9164_007799, partial [Protoblastenia rupestris]
KCFLANGNKTKSPRVGIESFKSHVHVSEPAAGFLHVLLPASGANIDFCRTSVSSAFLGYPLSQVTNWENKYNEEKYGKSATAWGGLLGTLKYLEELPTAGDDDLVLITDVVDTWFQLKPEVLIQRYRVVNDEAVKRARKRLGNNYKDQLRQDLVFAAQKQRQPATPTDPPNSMQSTTSVSKSNLDHDTSIPA